MDQNALACAVVHLLPVTIFNNPFGEKREKPIKSGVTVTERRTQAWPELRPTLRAARKKAVRRLLSSVTAHRD